MHNLSLPMKTLTPLLLPLFFFFSLLLLSLPASLLSQTTTTLNTTTSSSTNTTAETNTMPINPRLEAAYIALQALKRAITDDPNNITGNWCGPNVCNYTGVYCAPAPDNPYIKTVAGLDLNRKNITGTLPEELGLLCDLALIHLAANNFFGTLPASFSRLRILFELDVSSNALSGPFPSVVLTLKKLKYLDLRFNNFSGVVPDDIFSRPLDALFINNNNFQYSLMQSFGKSTASVIVLANTNINSCLPRTIGLMSKTLEQFVVLNSGLRGCLPPEIGMLTKLRVFDVSFNQLEGPLPETMGNLKKLEILNVAHNKLSGIIPESICRLPNLKNFTYSDNYFWWEPPKCLKIRMVDDSQNCIPYRPKQRSPMECKDFLDKPVHCEGGLCYLPPPPPPPPPYY